MTPQCLACGAPTDAYLCTTDTRRLEKLLAELPVLLDALTARAGGLSKTYRASSQTQRAPETDWKSVDGAIATSAMPGDLDAAKLLDATRNTITTTVRHLVESRHATPPAARSTWTTVTERRLTVRRNRATWVIVERRTQQSASIPTVDLVRWLHGHTATIRLDEAADQILTDLEQLTGRLERAVDNVPARFWAGPCGAKTMTGKCERDVYTRFNPFAPDARLDATFRCDGWRGDGRGCGAVHKVADRLGYVMDSVEDALLPLPLMKLVANARSLPWPSHQTISSWKGRGHLHVRTVARNGEELYRGGDVIDLIERWAVAKSGGTKRSA